MTTTIRAIETRYNGYRFRSRLEARWAVFFDTLGIRYEYEPEGFDLSRLAGKDYGWTDGGAPGEDAQIRFDRWYKALGDTPVRYLPDLFIAEWNTYVEIKPAWPHLSEVMKCDMLSYYTDKRVILVHGEPWVDRHGALLFEPSGEVMEGYTPYSIWDGFALCRRCSGVWMMYEEAYRALGQCCSSERLPLTTDSRLLDAYTAARQARFEFGESGRT